MTFLVIFLILIIFVLFYVVWNLYKKVVRHEKTILDYQTLFYEFFDRVQKVDLRLKEIDTRGSFSSDDEIGFFFKEVTELQKSLLDFLEKMFE